jgi:hypothetical protein
VKTSSVLVGAGLVALGGWPLWGGAGSSAQTGSSLQVSPPAQELRGFAEIPEIRHDESPPLRDIAPVPPRAEPKHEMRRHPRRPLPQVPTQADPVLQTSITALAAANPGVGFEGIGNGAYGYTVNAAPPDTNGAVGPNHYVQWVNTAFAVFSKTGALVWGPYDGNKLWSGFGGGCEFNNDGDPIVQYDKIADRWVFMQLSVSAPYPYGICLAVSSTGDPTGSYYRYELGGFGSEFPDYPKLGVWPDAYYTTFNLFNYGASFTGPLFCALNRSQMLQGLTATAQCRTLSSQYGSDLPSDFDGKTLPPAGSPAYFLEFDANVLNLWRFHVDWTNTANTTLTGPITIPVAAFNPACNGGGTCIPQAGTSQQLDSLGDRVMYRLAYRNFGGHESLVVNHSVTAGSSVGVRWYEIRSPGGTPTIYQQGTYAPDSSYRWMGSIAMDQAGNIGLGYSISSSSTHPGIRYTGRLATDPINTLQTESPIFDGAGSQNGGLSRWGDYSSISVDPADDCTFWYTNQYIPANGSFNWRTRIASFRFPSCGSSGSPDFALSASPSSQNVVQGAAANYSVTVTPSGGFTDTVTFSASGAPSGATVSFNPASVTGSGSSTSTMTVATPSNALTGTYTLTITGASSSGPTHTTSVTLVVTAAPPSDFSLSASPSSRTVTQGASTSYGVTITRSGGFSGAVTLSVGGMPSGAQGSFTPNPAGGTSSTLAVTTSSSTPAGTYSVTITGASGSLSHTTHVTLVVSSASGGDFSLSASPTSRTVFPGSQTTYTVSINRTGGFGGGVTFGASGVPSSATATFSPTTATGASSTLTIATSGNTPGGTYNIVITGTSGSLRHTTTVSLTVGFGGD